MAEEKVEARDFNIRQALPWTELFRSFQVALDLKKLLLAAAGILVMAFGWWLLAVIFYSQTKPDWNSSVYSASNFPGDTEEARKDNAWKLFKEDRHKWNVLHAAAGSTPEKTDAGDLAERWQDYDAVQAEIVGGKRQIQEKPYGKLRTWPFFEDRGPNPYLMATGQTGRPWESGHFAEWLLSVQLPVLIEPLDKFLYPVVHLLSPRAGFLNRFYFLLVTVWTLATWALFGGAITRMAAVQVARNDKIGMAEALRFVTARCVSFLSAPLFPLVFVAFVVFLLVIYGWLFMIPWLGDIVIAGIGWPLVILAGLAMAVVLVGLVGWPMMSATISAEGSDSFDAISRSYSYVYQSPWHYIWYSLVALGYGAVVVFFVGFMGSLIVYLGKWGVSQTPFMVTQSWDRDPSFLFVYAPTSFGWRTLLLEGATVNGNPVVKNGAIDEAALAQYTSRDNFPWYNRVGAWMVTAWLFLFFLLVLGFGYSYFWSASTIIYLLMRRKVDDTDLDEVYLEEDEAEESYSASTTVAPSAPAPSPAPAGGTLQMVESPTLRNAPPPTPPTPPSPAPAPTEAAAPPAGEGKPAPTDGANP